MAQAQGEGLLVQFVEKANIGRRKKEQQDYHGHLFLPPDDGRGRPATYLFAVADGVSMGMAGALASQTAVELLLSRFEQLMQTQTSDPVEALQQAYKAAADEIAALSEDRPGMATTCAATLLVGDRLVTTHVGDSRIYLARQQPGPQLILMGIDHSWVEEAGRGLVRNGELTEQDLLTDRRRHTITRALGMEGEVLIDFNTTQLQPGDLLLVCSDGLWDLIDPTQLEEFLLNAAADLEQLQGNPAHDRLKKLANTLEEAAMRAGGRDNITLNLALVERIGQPYPLPALPQLLAQTAQNVEERTSYSQREREPEENPTIEETVSLPTFRPYQPLTGAAKVNQPQIPAAPLNLDAIFSKAQKLFALGHWDEALEEFLQIEKHEPSYHSLYEVLSNTLLRYIEGAITQSQTERVTYLFNRLSQAQVTRYNEMLFDFCLEESRKASHERNYLQTKTFASFAAQLRPSDGRARNLQELSELYLMMEQAGEIGLGDRLALAQKIYARDPDFGAIQDDLASIYMQLGDEAARDGEENDALSWYQMIRPLRPTDARLISLATNKQRAIEDTLVRRENSQPRRPDMIAQPLVERPVPSVTSRINDRPPPLDIERSSEGRPDNEAINRLRERVSRAQKAWDAGRKEVGAEYIYLVDQFSALISPNPWQPTFPRVCYDYGKWLLDQKQYAEARPYFQKAYSLGMAAAQQRMNEIDRILREQASGGRGVSPLDLPDNPSINQSWDKTWKFGGAAETTSGAQAFYSEGDAARLAGGTRQPLIQRKPEIPTDATFVGTSHAGDGVLGSERPDEAERPPNPLSAASMAAGNSPIAAQENTPASSRERFDKPERLVGASGTQRRRDTNPPAASPLHNAASREVGRLQSQGLPQPNARPEVMKERRTQAFMNLLAGLAPALILGVVLAVIAIIALNLLGNLGKPSTQPDNSAQVATATIAATTPATTISNNPTVAPTAAMATGPNSVTARLEGIAPTEVRVFLAAPNDTPTVYRQRELVVDGSAFRLPQALVEKLDPNTKYTLVVQPRSNTARKFVEDLPLDAPVQALWTKPNVSFDARFNLEEILKIAPEALYFYPLDSGDQDLDLPGGGRYFKATRHTVRTDFFNFYNRNGGLGRFGFPIGEEFDWKDVGRVQFFERGWLVRSGEGELAVRIGKLGQTVLSDTSFDNALKPPASVGQASYKIDAAFTTANQNNLYGQPLSAAFEISNGNTKKRVQYFELARLETDPATKSGPVFLGLLGTEFARSKNWLR